ncbi:MAG: hypothetical protein LC539_14050 [Candidatus Thiodiazotropha sp.]|nr:hypothetical protein [Candidatus Thiodiazotropha sp.]
MDRLSSRMEDPRRQAFLQASLDLMRSGGYSDRPVSLPQALGAAGSSGIKTYHEAMRRKEETERLEQQRKEKEAAQARAEEARAYRHRFDEQNQQRAQKAHELKSKDIQSEIQHRREMDAQSGRKQSFKEDIYRQLMGGETQSQQAPVDPAVTQPPMPGGLEPPPQTPGEPSADPPFPPVPQGGPAAQPLFQPGSDVPRPPVAMASPPPTGPMPHPGADMPEPGEPPDRPIPDMPPGIDPQKLTSQQVILAKMMGIDLSDVYKSQHIFEETATKERAKKATNDVKELSKERRDITLMRDNYADLQRILKGFSGSGLTGMAVKLAEWGEAFGMTIDPRLDDKQAAKAIINQMVLKQRVMLGGMPGQLSDKDIVFLKATAPKLMHTEAGRTIIIERAMSLLNKQEAYVRGAMDWINSYGSLEHKEPASGYHFTDFWRDYREDREHRGR